MERQNLTVSLPKALLRKAKIVAAQREKSLSEIIRESLEEKVREANGYKKARERQRKLLESGLALGAQGKVTVTREELHARR
jgi:predicted transcriptional regulator